MNARTIVVRVLVVVGSALTVSTVLAGYTNRQVLDGPTFADHVDAVRRDDAVAEALGRKISTELIRVQPDLVAIRPLVESVAVQVAGSERLSVPVRRAAREAHTLLTEENADSIVLRIADAGAVVTAVLASIAPERLAGVRELSVTLAEIGDQAFASTTIALARAVGVLAWLLPVAALACFVLAVVLSRDRWRTGRAVGRALLAAAGVLALALVVGGWAVRRLGTEELADALVVAAWRVAIRPMWWSVALVAAAGLVVVLSCGAAVPAMTERLAVVRAAVINPGSPWAVGGRAAAAAIVGVAAVVDPLGLLEPLVALTGVGLVLFAIEEVARWAASARARHEGIRPDDPVPALHQRGWAVAPAAVGGVALLAGGLYLAWPGDDVEPVAPGAGDGAVCNGHAELCDRRFDEVAFAASHNAMSVAREPGWFLAEQIDPIPVQLDQGVRALLVDVWPGRAAGTVVRTAEGSRPEARAVAERELGPEVVAAALRIADSVAGQAQGPEARFLCHGLCETGSTPFLDLLAELRAWLLLHPDEVVTLFIEDHVPAAQLGADIEAAGLLPFVHQLAEAAPWPTLREMITAGERLVVMTEEGRSADHPWMLAGFEHTQDTPYTFPTVESFTCDPNRGPEGAPLFLLNHWLANFGSLVSDAQQVNDRDVLLARAERCREERGQIPNFVAVNFVTLGDLFAVVDALNGVE